VLRGDVLLRSTARRGDKSDPGNAVLPDLIWDQEKQAWEKPADALDEPAGRVAA
jgi:hypothetical protein